MNRTIKLAYIILLGKETSVTNFMSEMEFVNVNTESGELFIEFAPKDKLLKSLWNIRYELRS